MNRKLLFFVTEDWYFCSHRLPLAIAAREAGYEVALITRVDKHAGPIEQAGIRLIPIQLNRHGANPLRDLGLIWRLLRIYRREQPDVLHQVAMKPVLYGSLAARLAGLPKVVNALAGLGFLFSSSSPKARLLRPLARAALRLLLGGRGRHLIVQNPDDQALLSQVARLRPEQVHLVRGSGVDLEQFQPREAPSGPVTVMLPSRLLWDKGVAEFVLAAKMLKHSGARFVLVGKPDSGNPEAVAESSIHNWVEQGLVEHWGHSSDMPATLAKAHIVCLPSYREGLPKVLIEAAACALPIVTTDVPGCREVVRDGDNGLLVAVKSGEALAEALEKLISDPHLRQSMGRAGRKRAETEFSIGKVVEETLAVYAAG